MRRVTDDRANVVLLLQTFSITSFLKIHAVLLAEIRKMLYNWALYFI